MTDSQESVIFGEMAEWSIALPWKGSIRESVSGVRIPLSPLRFLLLTIATWHFV